VGALNHIQTPFSTLINFKLELGRS